MAKKIKITIDPQKIEAKGQTKQEDTPAYKVGEILQRLSQCLMNSDGILPHELNLKDNDGNIVGNILYR
jgi:hypothetical protein